MNHERQKLVEDNRLHIQAVRGWIADVRNLLHHPEHHHSRYVPIGTTEQENASLPADLALRFNYLEINYDAEKML
jgi:hypothetical protein